MSVSAALGRTLRHPSFRMAAIDMAGTSLGIAAWGLVTGVAMVKSGMSVGMAVFMSLLVYAGSAQLAVIPLLSVGAPLWVVWLTAACVNLRFVIFSSMWRSYFAHLPLRQRLAVGYFSGDVIYVAFMKRFPEPRPAPEQVPYFWGAASTNWLAWQVPSIAGILLANAVPLSWGLGFAGVLALLGVLLSLLFDRATWLATGVAATAAIAAFALPLKLNILVALAAAVAAGLLMEAVDRRRRQPELLLVPAPGLAPYTRSTASLRSCAWRSRSASLRPSASGSWAAIAASQPISSSTWRSIGSTPSPRASTFAVLPAPAWYTNRPCRCWGRPWRRRRKAGSSIGVSRAMFGFSGRMREKPQRLASSFSSISCSRLCTGVGIAP